MPVYSEETRYHSSRLPKGVIALGLVSLCMDLSSEMIHSLLPVFMVTVLGASALSVGLIEGVAEATAAIAKVFSGMLSDMIGRRKPLVLLGYGLAALTKPLFPLATGLGSVLVARFLDRIGKGIRGAPRDALIADITTPENRGTAYGLRQAMDTVGAFAAPLLAMALMLATNNNFRVVFWVATVPAIFCIMLIVFGVDEPEAVQKQVVRRLPLSRAELCRLPKGFWQVAGIAGVLTLARFSEAFLLLRAQNLGMAVAWVPLILIIMNGFYALSAYPFGRMADNGSRRRLLGWGIILLIVADLLLAVTGNFWLAGVGAAVWGLHMGATQGVLSALIADAAPGELRGTAFGIYNLISGGALLGASVIAGSLWTVAGPQLTFLAGAGFAALALAGISSLPRHPVVQRGDSSVG